MFLPNGSNINLCREKSRMGLESVRNFRLSHSRKGSYEGSSQGGGVVFMERGNP